MMNMLSLDQVKDRVSKLHVSTRAVLIIDMDCGGEVSVYSAGDPEDIDALRHVLNNLLNQ